MKYTVSMKCPDALDDSIKEAVRAEVDDIEQIDDEEREDLAETRADKYRDQARRWFRYGEYITVEIDTDAGTCVVVPT